MISLARSRPLHTGALLTWFVLALPPAAAQSFNIDVGSLSLGVPGASYGAGANQPGVWNGIDAGSAGTSFVLDDLAGTPTAVEVSYTLVGGLGNFGFDNAATTGDDDLLLDDLMDVGTGFDNTVWTFTNLTPGAIYDVYTYSWAPDARTAFKSRVDVTGAAEGVLVSGGFLWPGDHVLGRHFVRHNVTVPGTGEIVVTVTPEQNNASLNGFQLTEWGSCQLPVTYCTANPNSLGCNAGFDYAGTPSASSGEEFDISFGPVPGKNLGILIYSTNGEQDPPILGAFGFLCVSPSGLFRLPAQAAGGTSATTCDGRYEVDFNGWFQTQTANASLVPGAQVNAQFWYRDPPNPGQANFSNAIEFFMCP